MIVDNHAGAGGVIGADLVAKAAPTGHTLLVNTAAITINPGLLKKLPYDTLKDFIALARANPGRYNYASGGLRTSFHLYSELFNKAAGVSLTHVPYNSELVALLALPEVKARLLVAGIDARPSTPAEFQSRIARDIARWADVVKKAKIAVE